MIAALRRVSAAWPRNQTYERELAGKQSNSMSSEHRACPQFARHLSKTAAVGISGRSDREQSYACVNRHWELETSNCITLNFLLLFQKTRGKSSLIGT